MKELPPQSVLKGTALLFSGRMINRVFGLVREVLTASFFGTGWAMDCYNLSFTLVTSMRSFLGEQLLTPVVPTYFQRRNNEGETAALRSLEFITMKLNFSSLLICVGLFIFAKQVISVLAPGFTASQVNYSTTLLRWFTVGGIAFILHRYYSGIYMCFFQYQVISFAPLLMNIGAIGAIVFFGARFGVISLAAGFSVGFLASFLALAFLLPFRNKILTPRWGRGDTGVSTYISMLLPLFLAAIFEQIQLFIDRSLASGLPEGALSAQGYAQRLMRMSSDVWLWTFGTVLFPIFSSLAASEKKEDFAPKFSLALQAVMLFLFLNGAIIIALALPTVRLILQRGAFTSEDSHLTARLLVYYTVAYIAQALWIVVLRGFHAHGDTRTPVYLTVVSMTITIALDFILVRSMGIVGLALALALGYSLNFFLTFTVFSRHHLREHTLQNVRIFFLGLILTLPLGWMIHEVWTLLESRNVLVGFFPLLIGILALSACAGVLYFIVLRLIRVEALEVIIEKIRKKKG